MIQTEAPLCLPPLPLTDPVPQQLPTGTIDCHFHVFRPGAPLASPRSYTPQLLTIEDWLLYADALGIARGVLVQPSVYGLDNRVLLTALTGAAQRLRGIVVIPPDTDDAELQRLDRLGVRGVRINLRNKSGIGFDAVADLAPRIRKLGWHMQFQVGPEAITTVSELAARHEITGVIDHLAFMSLDPAEPALSDLRRALVTGRIRLKISAPYRLRDTADHAGYRQVISTLATDHAHALLWASDWPHTELFEAMPSDETLVDLSLTALPASAHERVFVRNAEALYWSH